MTDKEYEEFKEYKEFKEFKKNKQRYSEEHIDLKDLIVIGLMIFLIATNQFGIRDKLYNGLHEAFNSEERAHWQIDATDAEEAVDNMIEDITVETDDSQNK